MKVHAKDIWYFFIFPVANRDVAKGLLMALNKYDIKIKVTK